MTGERLRIAVVGCGAMGSVYAGLFAEAGQDVVALSRAGAHADAIARHGLRLSGASGDRVIQVPVATQAAGDPVDLLVLATKSFHAADAIRYAAPLIGPGTAILAIQNGLGASDEIAAIVNRAQLAVGIAAAFGATIRAPGHAHHENTGKISLGAYDSMAQSTLERIASVWTEAGIPSEAVSDIAAMQWEKLICNVAYSGLCGATGRTVGEVMDSPELGPISRAAATEAFEAALMAGIRLSVTDPVAHVLAFGEKVRGAKPSVLLDIEAGRPSEIGFINGAIEREARRNGCSAPVNATITAIVRDRESRMQADEVSRKAKKSA